MSARQVLRDERGASLTLALAFVLFISVFSVSILSMSGAGSVTSTVVTARQDQMYAAEGGMEYGIANLKADTSKCTKSGSYSWPAATVNGKSVTYSCTWVSGGTVRTDNPFMGDYAAVVHWGGINVPSGAAANANFRFDGSVHTIGSVTTQANHLINIDGDLTVADTFCPDPSMVIPTGICTTDAAYPTLPSSGGLVMPTADARSMQNWTTTCHILYPGQYGSGGRAWPAFNATHDYYLASGIYYINSASALMQGLTIFGGAKSASETKQLSASTPCATDANATTKDSSYTAAGTGITFVLGGSATMTIAGANTKAEFYSRVPGGTDAGSTPGIGLLAYPSDAFVLGGGGYTDSSIYEPSTIFSITSKAADVVFHGFTYLPFAGGTFSVIPNTQASTAPIFMGGVIISRMTITTDSDAGAVMNVASAGPTTITPRVVMLTSTATGTAGAANTSVSATVSPDGTLAVSNWRVT